MQRDREDKHMHREQERERDREDKHMQTERANMHIERDGINTCTER